MARSYGQIVAAIWRDPDFRKLPMTAQWAYIMLATQGDISSCGLLSITLGRWAGYAPDLGRDGLSDALSVLADARFIVADWDTEEILVRSFVKWDGGSTNSKRRPAIIAAAHGVVSPVLRAVLAIELDKLGVPHDIHDALSDTPSHSPSDALSDSHSIAQGSGYVSGVRATTQNRNHNPEPETTTLNPETATVAHACADAPTAQTIVAEWIDYVPKRPPANVIGQASKHISAMLAEGIDPHDVRRGVRAWVDKGLHPSAIPSVVNEVMNAGPRTAARKRNTDDRVRDGLALAQKLAADDGANHHRQIGA